MPHLSTGARTGSGHKDVDCILLRKLAAASGEPLQKVLERAVENYGRDRGREPAGERPVLIVSADPINQSAADLVVAVPFTTRRRGVPTHVEVHPPAGGLREVSFAMCEQVRSLSTERLGSRAFGSVPAAVLSSVQDRLRLLLRL